MRPRWIAPAVGLGLLAGLFAGVCARAPQADAGRTPLDAFRALVAARASGGYRAVEQHILAERAEPVIETLSAVDEFLAANARLCDHLRRESTPGVADALDLSRLADSLEAFSRCVEPISASVRGAEASVSFQVGGNLPLKHAQFRLVDGSWRYDPGEGYDERLPAAFRRMTRGLEIALDDFTSGRIPRQTLRDDPQRVLAEVRLRLLPGIQMLPPQLRDD